MAKTAKSTKKMAKKTAPRGKRSEVFNSALVPLAAGLPAQIAANVGGTLARHAYLDWVLGQVMYSLMEISIKQGRVIMKLPRPSHYIAAVKDLFGFHGLETNYDFEELARKLETSERTRNLLTRSVYMRDSSSKEGMVHLARSPWDPGPGGETQPESQKVDRKFLAGRRKDVDDAVRAAEKLQTETNKLLRKMHELRRSRPGFNRRKSPR
jgi:hypothetical protein